MGGVNINRRKKVTAKDKPVKIRKEKGEPRNFVLALFARHQKIIIKKASKKVTLLPKDDISFSFQPFLLFQGIIISIIILTLVFIFISFSLPSHPINQFSVIKNVTIKQNSAIIAGKPVEWTMLVKRGDIKSGQYLARLPKGAKITKISVISQQQAENILSAKPKQSLSLNQRKQLAAQPEGPETALSQISQFLFADVSDAVDNTVQTITGSSTDQNTTSTPDATYVDLSSDISSNSESAVTPATSSDITSTPETAPASTSTPTTTSAPSTSSGSASSSTSTSSSVLTTINISPLTASITAGSTQQLTATGLDQNGNQMSSTFSWSSDNTDVATVDDTGLVTAVTPGTASITASSGSVTSTAPAVVTATESNNPESSSDYVAVDYTTSAPQIEAQTTSAGEQVTVSATDEDPNAPLVDVIASAHIPKIFKVGEENKIKIKWVNNDNQNVTFHAYDTDGDGYLDYVEWTVPHLSDQIFDIIFISKAFQLDSDQNILADIYPQVQSQDGVYASITDGQYVRVTFEQNLDNTKDLTIYARPTPNANPFGNPSIQVYPVYTDSDGNQTEGGQLVTASDGVNPDFSSIDHDGKYRILLSNLQTPTDVFDLKISGDIDFDYILDPTTYYPAAGSGSCNWSSSSCWSTSLGGAHGAAVPTSTDTVNMEGATGTNVYNIATDASSDVTGILTSTYNATATNQPTLAFTSGKTLTVSGSVTFDPNIALSGTGTLAIAGTSTITPNSVSFPGSVSIGAYTANLASNWTVTGNLSNTGNAVINGSSLNLYVGGNLALASGDNMSGSATIVMNGTGTWSAGNSSSIVSNPLTINTSGTITVSGTVYYGGAAANALTYTAGTMSIGTSTLAIAGSCTLNTNGMSWYSLSIGAFTITLNSNLTVAGNFANSGTAVINGSGYNLYVGGNFTENSNNITGTATLVFNGTGTISANNGGDLGLNVIFNTSGTITISGLQIASSPTITYVAGTINCTGAFNLESSATLNTAGMTWGNITAGASSTITLLSSLTASGTFKVATGNTTMSGSSTVSVGALLLTTATSSAAYGLTLSSNWTVSNGITFLGSGASTGTITGQTINLTGGTWQGASTGTGTINSNLTITNSVTVSGSVYYGTGTLNSSGAALTTTGSTLYINSTCSITDGVNSWNNLVGENNGTTITLNSNLTLIGSLSVTDHTTTINGAYNIYVGGNISGLGLAGTATLVMDGTGTWSNTGGVSCGNPITFNTSGTITLGNISYSGNTITDTSGTINTAGSTLSLSYSGTVALPTAITWNNISVGQAETINITNNLTLTGSLSVTAYSLTINGAYNVYVGGGISLNSTTPLGGTATVVLDGTGTWSSSGGAITSNLTINTSGTITVSGTVYYGGTAANVLTYTSGTMATSGSTLDIAGSCTLNTGNMNGTTATAWYNITMPSTNPTITLSSNLIATGTITVGNSGTTIITMSGSPTVQGASLGAGTGTTTLALSSNWTITGTLTAPASHTFTINNNTMYIGGSLTILGSNLAGSTTIIMNGTGSWTSSGGAVSNPLTFNTSGTITVSGNVYYSTGTLTYSSGTMTLTGSTLNIAGSCTFTDATNTWANINATATSTLTLSQATTISGNLSAATGVTLTLASNPITIGGNLTNTGTGIITGQTITMTGASGTATWSSGGGAIGSALTFLGGGNTITVSGSVYYSGTNMTYTSGTITTTGSTLTLSGGSQTIPTAITWNSITISAGTPTITLANNLNLTGSLKISSATATSGAYNINVAGSLTVNSNITGAASIIMNGTGTWSGAGYVEIPLTFNTSGTITVSGNVYYETGTLTYTSGTMSMGSSVLLIEGSCTLNTNGMSWANITVPATVTITLSSNLSATGTWLENAYNTTTTMSGSHTVSVGTLSFTTGLTLALSSNWTVTGSLQVTGSTNPAVNGAYNVYVGGSFTNNGTAYIYGTATVVMNGTGTWGGSSDISINTTFNTSGTITVSGTVYLVGETNNLYITYVSGTMITTGSTLSFGGNPMYFDTSNMTWNNITNNGWTTLNLTSDLNIAGTLTNNSSKSLTVSGAHNINVAGNWTNNGTYAKGTETVVFNGTSTQILAGATTFNNLTFAPGSIISITSTQIFTIAGTFTATGSSAHPITINATGGGSQGILSHAAATINCYWLSLTDSKVQGGATWNAYSTTSVGDNTGWTFPANSAPIWTGGVIPSDGGAYSGAPVNVGNNVNFTGTANDPDLNNYYLAICKTGSVTAVNNGAPTCPGGNWCISGVTASGSQATCSYTTLIGDAQSNAWYGYACDQNAASLCSSPANQGSGNNASPFYINHAPTFSTVTPSPSSVTPGTQITFTSDAADQDSGDSPHLYLCKNNTGWTGTSCGAGNEWCDGTTSCNYTPVYTDGKGSKDFYAYVIDSHNFPAAANYIHGTFTINNALPTVTSVHINSGASDIILLPNITENVSCTANIGDLNGYSDIVSVSAVFYDSEVSLGGSDDYSNHYTLSGAPATYCSGSGTSGSCTFTFPVYFYADPTDGGSPYNWICNVSASDNVGPGSNTSTITMDTLKSFSISSSTIYYGSLTPQSASSGTHKVTATNTGNISVALDVSGNNLSCSVRSSVPVTDEYYNLDSNFSYPGGTSLSASSVYLATLSKPTQLTVPVSRDTYWQVYVPGGTQGSCSGNNSFTAE